VNPTRGRPARRAVLPLLILAAVAALAAPAYADPPPSGDGGDSGTGGKVAAAVVRNLSDKDPWPDPPVLDIDVSGGGSAKNGPNAAIANPPPDQTPAESVTGETAETTVAVAGPPPDPDPEPTVAGPPPVLVED
jgi:hypothetical protein